MWYNLGDAGKHSDGGVFGNCLFGQALEDGDLDIPEDSPLPGLTLCINYYIYTITTPIINIIEYMTACYLRHNWACFALCHGGRRGISITKVLVTSFPWEKSRGEEGNF